MQITTIILLVSLHMMRLKNIEKIGFYVQKSKDALIFFNNTVNSRFIFFSKVLTIILCKLNDYNRAFSLLNHLHSLLLIKNPSNLVAEYVVFITNYNAIEEKRKNMAITTQTHSNLLLHQLIRENYTLCRVLFEI